MPQVDCFNYWPAAHIIISHAKDRLPSHIRAALMKGSVHADFGIYVDASRPEMILELDALLGICRKRDFGKDHVFEIDKAGIADHEYFLLSPRELEDSKDVFFDLTRPTCSSDTCPWGAGRVSPVRIKPKALKGLGIARIGRMWDFQTVELVLSSEVRNLFQSEKVTGLEYEECWPSDLPESSRHGSPPAYVARIENGTYQSAKDVYVGQDYCQQHSIAVDLYPFCLWTPREALSVDDFQMLHTIKVGSREYYPYKSLWVVSRRIVVLLLENRVSGLKPATVFLKEPFRPLLTDDKHWEHD